MIGNLMALIEAARKEIAELEVKIGIAEKELAKCVELKPILDKINSSALCGYNALQKAGNSLNAGIKISGVGQGEKILERSIGIQKLGSNALAASANVQLRITELENNIETWNARIASLHSSIAGWQAEIARLEEEARRAAAEEEKAMRRKGR